MPAAQWRCCLELTCLPLRGQRRTGVIANHCDSSVTGFPESLDGRVKTLHPRVHGGLLARRETRLARLTGETGQTVRGKASVVKVAPKKVRVRLLEGESPHLPGTLREWLEAPKRLRKVAAVEYQDRLTREREEQDDNRGADDERPGGRARARRQARPRPPSRRRRRAPARPSSRRSTTPP